MTAAVKYLLNKASAEQIAEHLQCCDADFVPPLTGRVEIKGYADKIANRAMRFEAWSGGTLVGLVAAYCNDQEKLTAFITSVSVLKSWTGEGIAASLMNRCVEYAKASGMRQVSLKVAHGNTPAIKLYEKNGFVAGEADATFVILNLFLESGGRA